MKRNLVFEVGRGDRIFFCYDLCCGEVSVKHCFPKIHSITRDKDALISDLVERTGAK